MAMGAIALGGIVERAWRPRAPPGAVSFQLLAGQEGVVLAAEGLELDVILLIGPEGLQNGLERRAGVGEDRCAAKRLAQLGGVGRERLTVATTAAGLPLAISKGESSGSRA